MEQGNAMVRRLYYALTDGYNEADILVYHSIESFWYHYIPDNRYTHGFFRGSYVEGKKAEQIDHNMQIVSCEGSEYVIELVLPCTHGIIVVTEM